MVEAVVVCRQLAAVAAGTTVRPTPATIPAQVVAQTSECPHQSVFNFRLIMINTLLTRAGTGSD
jgi:hypothetical protein